MSDPKDRTEDGDELVAFFRSLSANARAEYEKLAERDRRFGEDVKAEAGPVIGWFPEPDALVQACARIAPELGLDARASETALRVALREADHLADDVYDVPAALLFALGRTPRCFTAFRAMSVLVTQWQAKTLGYKLEASPLELGTMLGRVARSEVDFETVKGWVSSRQIIFGG